MFKFNPDLLRVQYVKIMSVTTALGGALRIEDPDNIQHKGIRIEIPFAVARAFIVKYKTGRFLIPIDGCLVWYGDNVVNIERRQVFSVEEGWKSECERIINRFLLPLLAEGSIQEQNSWYTDGVSIYQLPANAYDDTHEPLTSDGKFSAVSVRCVKFKDLMMSHLIQTPATCTCVAFKTDSEKKVLSPPIWKNVLDIRSTIEQAEGTRRFDTMNEHLNVNLEFVLSAAKSVGENFGFQYTIPLRLEDYMINLNTVNLPNLDKSIREVYTANMSFTVAFAWLLSFCDLSKDLTQYMAIRASMKMLCTKGTFSKLKTDVLQKFTCPPMITAEQALVNATNMTQYQIEHYFETGGLVDHDGISDVLLGGDVSD